MNRARRRIIGTLAAVTFAAMALGQDGQVSDPMAGTTVEPLGSFAPSEAPDRALVLIRIIMEPGATIPYHRHPGAVVVTVESGTFGTNFDEGHGTLMRADGTTEDLPAGSTTTMEAGDSLAYEGAVHTMVNEGDGRLVLLVAALLDPEQPGFVFMDM